MKMLHSETPSGKVARWVTLQWVIDALWPDGIGVALTGEPVRDEDELRTRLSAAHRRYRKRDLQARKVRTHLREYASAKEARP